MNNMDMRNVIHCFYFFQIFVGMTYSFAIHYKRLFASEIRYVMKTKKKNTIANAIYI